MQNFEIVVVDDKEVLAAIGSIKFPISIDFIRENYPLLSFSEQEWREKKVGIMGTMFPPEWLNPDVTEEDLAGESENEFLRTQIESAPILCVVTYDPTHRRSLRRRFPRHYKLGLHDGKCVVDGHSIRYQSSHSEFPK